MSLSGVVDIAVYLDSLEVFDQKLPGSLRIAVSVFRKKGEGLLDKVQAKKEFATPFKGADRSADEIEEVAIYCNDVEEGDVALLRANPYILTDSFYQKTGQSSSERKREIKKAGYFRIALPCYPSLWSSPILLQIDLLMKPQVLHVSLK